MIRREKYEQALRAMNSILTRARWLGHEGKIAELTEQLDAAEILPKYLVQPDDITDVFSMPSQRNTVVVPTLLMILIRVVRLVGRLHRH
jgi:hypothetical protein